MPDQERLLRHLLQALSPETRSRIAIVGGQALGLWAFHYLIDELSPEDKGYVSSDDLDLFGRHPEVRKCAEAWETGYQVPDASDPTASTGKILIDSDPAGQPLLGPDGKPSPFVVDFLGSVYGIKDHDLQKGLDALILDDLEIPILTPVLCLKSRMRNLHSLGYSPHRVEREMVRVNVAIRVTRAYLLDVLESEGGKRKALRIAKKVMELAREAWCIELCVKYGFEPLDAIPERHAGFGPQFASLHFPSRRERILRKRKARERITHALAGRKQP